MSDDDLAALVDAQDEIKRLQEAKRRALAIADERSKENVRLRAERDAMVKALRWIADNPGAHPTNIKVIAMDALGDVGQLP